MLVIRPVQMQELGRPGLRRFVDETTAHVREVWRAECAKLGEAGPRQVVEAAVERARVHGLQTRLDVGRFVHLVFAFENSQFDTAAWAEEILADRSVNGRIRMNRLWAAAQDRIAAGDKA